MNQSNILDNPFPDIGVPALEPTQCKQFLPSLKTIADNASAKIKKRVNEFADWFTNYVPPRTKANSIQKILNLFPKRTMKAKLLKAALNNFAKSCDVNVNSMNRVI